MSAMTPLNSTSVEEIAKKRGASMAQISLAWILTKEGSYVPFVERKYRPCVNPSVHAAVSAPIVGTTSLDKLKELIGRDMIPILYPTADISDNVESRCNRYQPL